MRFSSPATSAVRCSESFAAAAERLDAALAAADLDDVGSLQDVAERLESFTAVLRGGPDADPEVARPRLDQLLERVNRLFGRIEGARDQVLEALARLPAPRRRGAAPPASTPRLDMRR